MMHVAELVRNALERDPAHPHFIKTLDRYVLQLSIDLLDHELHGDEYESAIVSFRIEGKEGDWIEVNFSLIYRTASAKNGLKSRTLRLPGGSYKTNHAQSKVWLSRISVLML